MAEALKIVTLAGGVGGAKLADGISRCLHNSPITVVVNTGDDLELFGLHISPDLDTVCYTLAGLANPSSGWGRMDETWKVYEELQKLGAPDWFHLGDKDLALHLERTRLLQSGQSLSEATRILCTRLGIKDRVIPMTDQPVRTLIFTQDGSHLSFQEYFVKEQCEPVITGFEFKGIRSANPADGILQLIEEAHLVILCPSNPWVSIDPILLLNGIRPALRKKSVIAVSPIIGGKTIKGPAAKMFREMGKIPCSLAVAEHYQDFLTGIVIDHQDTGETSSINDRGIIPLVTNTIMRTIEDRIQLAKETIDFGMQLARKGKNLV
jgi:LPPG:FO 2-phospho-L-lactate transferase